MNSLCHGKAVCERSSYCKYKGDVAKETPLPSIRGSDTIRFSNKELELALHVYTSHLPWFEVKDRKKETPQIFKPIPTLQKQDTNHLF